jgi:hypothetical protein
VVIHKEDTATRLTESQFGYQSYHYVLKLPENWLTIPSFQGFDDYSAEIQIRTLAQHIWAVASHELQYKQEASVPQTIRRSISRVSALLETVDLEFERTLSERDQYLEELKKEIPDELLNVDLLKKVLDKHLPIERRDVSEPYSELLQNLTNCGINKSSQLISLINEQLENVVQKDSEKAKKIYKCLTDKMKKPKSDMLKDMVDRLRRGIKLSHVGLVREMLSNKFGDRWKVINESDWAKVEVVNKKPKNNNENKPSNQ